jgi:hypothetical protein
VLCAETRSEVHTAPIEAKTPELRRILRYALVVHNCRTSQNSVKAKLAEFTF